MKVSANVQELVGMFRDEGYTPQLAVQMAREELRKQRETRSQVNSKQKDTVTGANFNTSIPLHLLRKSTGR